jgi:DNA-binding helix-hairpin-helix protein with protein kinase domain
VQELMWACFEEGRTDPKRRPSAAAWQRALQEAEGDLLGCAANAQHFFHRGLAECPWCGMAKRSGRDPFPELVTEVEVVREGPAIARRSARAGAPTAADAASATYPVAQPARLVPWLRPEHPPAGRSRTPRWLWWIACTLLAILVGALLAALLLYRAWARMPT